MSQRTNTPPKFVRPVTRAVAASTPNQDRIAAIMRQAPGGRHRSIASKEIGWEASYRRKAERDGRPAAEIPACLSGLVDRPATPPAAVPVAPPAPRGELTRDQVRDQVMGAIAAQWAALQNAVMVTR